MYIAKQTSPSSSDGRKIYYASITALHHARHKCLASIVNPLQVYINHSVPVGLVDINHSVGSSDAGIINQYINRAHFLFCLLAGLCSVFRMAYVRFQEQHTTACLLHSLQCAHALVCFFQIQNYDNRGLSKRKKTLADAEKRIAELDTIFKRLYEDTISGKLSDERFQKLSTDYEKEQHQLQDVAIALRDEIEVEERKSANVERFLSVVERYTEIPELTPCILHEFIEKIVVHAASDPKGKNRTQEIDIYYKGIGALEVSKVTSSRQE